MSRSYSTDFPGGGGEGVLLSCINSALNSRAELIRLLLELAWCKHPYQKEHNAFSYFSYESGTSAIAIVIFAGLKAKKPNRSERGKRKMQGKIRHRPSIAQEINDLQG